MTADVIDVEARQALRRKALTAIREGRVTVLMASTRVAEETPNSLIAGVRSSRPGVRRIHVVEFFEDAGWTCTCGPAPCAHAAAVQLVAGYGPRR